MIWAVVDMNTREILYKVKNDGHNACVERGMLNACLPALEQHYAVGAYNKLKKMGFVDKTK